MDTLIDPEADVRRWGPLTILGPIGEGRFGQVFRAWDARLHRQVALKVLHAPAPEASASPSHAIDEARLLARVRHPNVLTIYGAEALDGQVGIWTEFIEGRTLEEVLAERGPLPPDEVAAIGVDLCRALTAVHDAGLLHRDIKAQNVMRETGGRIVLMDFGTGHDLEVVAPRAGDMSGTPLYLAPEIFAGGTATVVSDIYALAVLLHRLLTGRYPVEGRTLDDVRAGHIAGSRTVVNQTETALSAVIDRGLSVDPALRFQSAAVMEQALLASAEVVGPGNTPQGPRTRRRAWRMAGFMGIAASFVLAAWWAVQRLRWRLSARDASACQSGCGRATCWSLS
jgi:serine/threonine-protein kinase